MKKIYCTNLGLSDYKSVWKLQQQINSYKQTHNANDIILVTQHNKVFTLGRGGDINHLLMDKESLKREKVSYYEIDRGGDLTYHGPGQLVCYPIIDLKKYYKDSHRYLRDLEEVIILSLKDYGIDSHRDEQYTGVWVGEEKICALGIKISRWITMHGLAFNVNNDLSYFNHIIPCGIFHKNVTSVKKILKKEVQMDEVTDNVLKNFGIVFGSEIISSSPKEMDYLYALKEQYTSSPE